MGVRDFPRFERVFCGSCVCIVSAFLACLEALGWVSWTGMDWTGLLWIGRQAGSIQVLHS